MTEATKQCTRCLRERDRKEFYPNEPYCIECNKDIAFLKRHRRMAREQGEDAVYERIRDYRRKIDLMHEALNSFERKQP